MRTLPLLLLLVAAGCHREPAPAAADPPPYRLPPIVPLLPPDPAAAALVATVDFAAHGGPVTSRGSAFYVRAAGGPAGSCLMLTCGHVVAGGALLGVPGPDGRQRDVAIVLADPAADRAWLRVDGDAPAALPLSDRAPAAGEAVWVVDRLGVHPGAMVGPHDDPELGATVLLAVPGLGPGASGGAVVDKRGFSVAVVRGAVDDDSAAVVAVPVGRVPGA